MKEKNQHEHATLSCPQCGGQLETTTDLEIFKCPYCQTELVIRPYQGELIFQALSGPSDGPSPNAGEKIAKLRHDIERLENQIKDDVVQGQNTGAKNFFSSWVMGAGLLGGLLMLVILGAVLRIPNRIIGIGTIILGMPIGLAWVIARQEKTNKRKRHSLELQVKQKELADLLASPVKGD